MVFRQEGERYDMSCDRQRSDRVQQNERMVPIVIALVPTIVGSGLSLPHSLQRIALNPIVAVLVGMANSGQKGVLLFGER
jgi:hypothetical protein